MALASAGLTQVGVRFMEVEGASTTGIWSDLDGPDVRSALFTLGSGQLPIRYLDAGDIPIRYKSRWVEGEPVPMSVLRASRDRILDEMGWWSKGRLWAEWKGQELNRLFQEQENRVRSRRQPFGTSDSRTGVDSPTTQK